MNNLNLKSKRENESDLQRLIEPLASYICATDHPKTAVRLALVALIGEVEQTNRAANARVTALLKDRFAVPA